MYKLFEFVVEWIPAIRNKAELFSVQKITFITAIAEKKIISVFCVSEGIVLATSVCGSSQIPVFFSLTLFSHGIHNRREKS